MNVVDNYRLRLKKNEYIPIIIGGMGVDISTPELALEAARLGGIGHISDAMVPFVCDKKFGSSFTANKLAKYKDNIDSFDKSNIKFDLEDLHLAQLRHVESTVSAKKGPGAIFVNVMEKLTMADPLNTLRTRLRAALDGGIDGITLSAGLHNNSLKLIEDHPRFRDVLIGIIVSSPRALKIFLRTASRVGRLPDYVIVEGPLAGGHLGFGLDWQEHDLAKIVQEVIALLKTDNLQIPVIAAGGVFTGSDAVKHLETGASGVQVATRFTVTKEAGLSSEAKQSYFRASEEQIIVSCLSPTGYPIRMLTTSPCINSNVKPQCEAFGYILDGHGNCQYLEAYKKAVEEARANAPMTDKMCLCTHFSRASCYTCGHYAYRLKDTSIKNSKGQYQLLTVEHVFKDYQFGKDNQITLPNPESEAA